MPKKKKTSKSAGASDKLTNIVFENLLEYQTGELKSYLDARLKIQNQKLEERFDKHAVL